MKPKNKKQFVIRLVIGIAIIAFTLLISIYTRSNNDGQIIVSMLDNLINTNNIQVVSKKETIHIADMDKIGLLRSSFNGAISGFDRVILDEKILSIHFRDNGKNILTLIVYSLNTELIKPNSWEETIFKNALILDETPCAVVVDYNTKKFATVTVMDKAAFLSIISP